MRLNLSRGLITCLLLSSAAYAAEPPGKLPCQPDAQCALRMAREAAVRRVLSARDDDVRRRALNVILWTAEKENSPDPQNLQPMFKSLRARIDATASAKSRQRELSRLARAMASSGLVADARLLARQLGGTDELDGVNVAAAGYYARHGRVREAFEIVKAMPKEGIASRLAMGGALNGVASTGRPELVREIPRDLPGSDASLFAGTEVLALSHAGQHDAARAAAQKITDGKARMATFLLLYNRYKERGPQEQFLPAARALYRSIVDMPLTADMRKEATKMLLEAMGENERTEELALIAELPVEEREDQLQYLVGYLRTAEQVHAASKIIASLPADEREELEQELIVSRVRIGELSADAAMEQMDESMELFDGLRQLVHEFARANETARARQLIQALVAHLDDGGSDTAWSQIADAQIAAGLLAQAEKTINERVQEPPYRVSPLLALSIAQAKAGQKAQAARTRAQADEEYQSFAEGGSRMGGLALEYWKLEMLDEAEAELRRHIAAKAPARDWNSVALSVVGSRARKGDLAGALEFARYLSANLDDDPGPFVRVYNELDPGMGPPDGELPWAPIRADIEP